MSKAKDPVKIRGMFRLHITEDHDGKEKIVGDSGWHENIITNVGFLNMVNQMGSGLTGTKLAAANLGTGGYPVATDTILSGEVSTNVSGSVLRVALTAATSSTSKTLHNTATFASTNSFITAAANISNVGLFSATGPYTGSGSLMQGQTYTSSALATNQNVNLSYDLIFS